MLPEGWPVFDSWGWLRKPNLGLDVQEFVEIIAWFQAEGDRSLPDFKPRGTRYESANYGISN